MNRTAIKARFYMLANEVSGAALLNTGDGSGGTTTTQDDALNLLLDEAQDWLAQFAFPIEAEGTIATTLGNRNYSSRDAGALTAGRALFDWHTAAIGTTTLTMVRESSLRTNFRNATLNYATAASGTPEYSYRTARGMVGLFRPPTAALTVKLFGFALPFKFVDNASSPTWLIEPDHELLAFYALLRAAKKRLDDPVLAQRMAPHQSEFLARCDASWSTIDPITREAHFPLMPRAAIVASVDSRTIASSLQPPVNGSG